VIRAKARVDAGGCLLDFSADGHAQEGKKGYDIVCAAFSVLARTAYRVLEALPGTELGGAALERGSLSFGVSKAPSSPERAAGVADFLIEGLRSLALEYPEAVEFTVEHDWRE
jgi:uncharacterized protein YsxB (DUF464 family)